MIRSLLKAAFFYWIPVLFYLFILKTLSSQPTLPVPGFWAADKLCHSVAFLVLGFLWARAFHSIFPLRPGGLVLVAIWGCFLYGVLDEFLIQAATPGRFPSVADLAADLVGGSLGGVLFGRIMRWRRFLHIMG